MLTPRHSVGFFSEQHLFTMLNVNNASEFDWSLGSAENGVMRTDKLPIGYASLLHQ